jgi:small subunit ribosomal protein S18
MSDDETTERAAGAESETEERPSRFGPRARTESAGDGERPRGRRTGGGPRFGGRRKVCTFCMDGVKEVDYKDMQRLRRHLSKRGKIEPRRKTGTCAKHQRSLTVAIKRARHVALLPFVGGSGRY